MNKQEYSEYVQATAAHVLNICQAQEAIDEKKDFYEWYGDQENDNSISNALDARYRSDWKFATEVLGHTDTNPDNIESCLYDNCHWEVMLIRLSFQCWQEDVREAMEKAYTSGEWSSTILSVPSFSYQLGFFPDVKVYRIPLGGTTKVQGGYRLGNVGSRQFTLTVFSSDIYIAEKEHQHEKSLVLNRADRAPSVYGLSFDPTTSYTKGGSLFVVSKRVRTHFNCDIKEALQFAKENFGVREVKPKKSKG